MKCLAATRDVCGEGCVWHPQLNAVFWADINRGLLHRYSVADGTVKTWTFHEPVTAVLLTTQEHLLALVLGGRIVIWDTCAQGIVDVLFRLPEWPAVRCNDARVDPASLLWFGTMQNNVRDDETTADITEWKGAFYSLGAGKNARQWQDGFGITNTLAWSPDGRTMYFGDTLRNCIYRGDFDVATSSLEHREIFFEGFGRGLPDGSAVDADGFLWNCRYGGSCVVRVAPSGAIAAIYETPVANPTTCAFGGPRLETLFITSAADGSETGGSLFSFSSPVPGLPTTPLRL